MYPKRRMEPGTPVVGAETTTPATFDLEEFVILSSYQARMIETIRTADFSAYSYEQLFACREFAHYSTPRLAEELLPVWFERGEAWFQAAQAARRAAA